jgi:LCP family protein required for cell wall assembly
MRRKGVNLLRRWIKVTAAVILVVSVVVGVYAYWKLEPKRHFERASLPILAMPAKDSTSAPQLFSEAVPVPSPLTSPNSNEPTAKAFNVLLLGVDARNNEQSRSDVIIVVRVIPGERKINMVSVPRDTRVEINGIGWTKINHAHILGELEGGNTAGTKAAIKAVSNLMEIPINYYVKTNFQGFENFIDMVGGVDVHIESDMLLRASNVTLHKGNQHMDGNMALALVRERWAFADGDFGRQSEQAQILRNVAEELLKPEHIPQIAELLTKLKKDILDTNFSDSDLISLAWLFKGMKGEDFRYAQIPGHSAYEVDDVMKSRLYYWIPDTKQLKALEETFFN